LQETGKVSLEQLESIADMAINDGSIIYNPKESDRGELRAVLAKAWGVVSAPTAAASAAAEIN